MLVLSKLDWEVNLVIALDYLEPLNTLQNSAETEKTGEKTEKRLPKAETNELKNLICTLSSRYATFRAIYSARIVALASLKLQKSNISQLFELSPTETEKLRQCTEKYFSVTEAISHQTPNNSPFKIESTSTPKSSRTPLKDLKDVKNSPIRRRLTSLSEESKENNDSAIGYMLNFSPPPSITSKTSSKTSSPDSGASSGDSPKSNKDVQEIDKILQSTLNIE